MKVLPLSILSIKQILKGPSHFLHVNQVLNVSGDRLESLDELTPLLHLRHLMANDNFLESANEVAEVLSGFNQLDKAELLGNPCVSKARCEHLIK